MVSTPASSLSAVALNSGSGFPVPFTRDAFQRDLVVLFTHQLRTIALMKGFTECDGRDAWQSLYGRVPTFPKSDNGPTAIYSPEHTIDDFGLTFADIADTWFATYLDSMYQYAYFGISEDSLEQMEEDTISSWLATIVYDLSRSAYLDKWQMFDGEGKDCAARCLEVAELANARRILEVGCGFSSLLSISIREEGTLSEGALTVRQMALLAGMEEMSIRAAANPKRATPLKTASDHGRTRILTSDARDWLQARGRYVPIQTHNASLRLDLSKTGFPTLAALTAFIDNRLMHLSKTILLPNGTSAGSASDLDAASFEDSEFVSALASLLEVPKVLFALRVREVLAKVAFDQIQRELRDATAQPVSVNR